MNNNNNNNNTCLPYMTTVNAGFLISPSPVQIPMWLSDPWLKLATMHSFTWKTSDSRCTLIGRCSSNKNVCLISLHNPRFCSFRIKDNYRRFIKQKLYNAIYCFRCYQLNFELNMVIQLNHVCTRQCNFILWFKTKLIFFYTV